MKDAVQLKYKLQRTWTWSSIAWLSRYLCYRPAILFRHSHIIALSFPQWKIQDALKKKLYFSLFPFMFKTFASREVSAQCCALERKLSTRRHVTSTGNAAVSSLKFCSSSAIVPYLSLEGSPDGAAIRGRIEHLQVTEYTHLHSANLAQKLKFAFFPSYGNTRYQQSCRA